MTDFERDMAFGLLWILAVGLAAGAALAIVEVSS